jgi:hypothetical protein
MAHEESKQQPTGSAPTGSAQVQHPENHPNGY